MSGSESVKISEDVRKFAAEQKISEEQALQVGLEQKAKEFKKSGAEVFAKA
jgi:phosphomethylpyrimidine synthase